MKSSLSIFGILVSLFFVLISCSWKWIDEYDEHFSSIHTFHTWSIQEDSEKNFAISGTLDLYSFPNKWWEKMLTNAIKEAKEKVWIAVYIWTNKNIADALIDAKNRWVDVRVILEPNVYKTPTINRSIASYFQKRWVDIVYSDNDRYKFTHAKFWIIDSRFFVSTWNLTYSLFKNKEYIIFWDNKEIHTFLTSLFAADFSHKNLSNKIKFPDSLAVAPINARSWVKYLLQHADSHIQLYMQYISDQDILDQLANLKKTKPTISIDICVSGTQENRELASVYPQFRWKQASSPYLHAKVMILDSTTVFLWSQNLSQNALDNNREVSVIFSNRPKIVNLLETDIQSHCKNIENK